MNKDFRIRENHLDNICFMEEKAFGKYLTLFRNEFKERISRENGFLIIFYK